MWLFNNRYFTAVTFFVCDHFDDGDTGPPACNFSERRDTGDIRGSGVVAHRFFGMLQMKICRFSNF